MTRTDRDVRLDDVFAEAWTLTAAERHARIRECVAATRHDPRALPRCVEPVTRQRVPYCDRCWSLIDSHGLTWSRLPDRPFAHVAAGGDLRSR